MKWNHRKFICVFLILLLLVFTGCQAGPAESSQEAENSGSEQSVSVSQVNDEGYTLEEMVILGRHNVRAPLSTEGSDLYKMTTHQWCNWSSNASDLSMRGGELEVELGQYLRKYLAAKGLLEENTVPEENQVRIYANSKQRTLATATYLAAGMFPLANIDVEYHEEIGSMDPVFNPVLTFVSDSYQEQVMKEIASMGGTDGLNGIEEGLKENYTLLEQVLDFQNSAYAEEHAMTVFPTDDLQIQLELGKEPSMTGSLKTACSAADALVLQYYEVSDATEAGFGNALTFEQWKSLANIKETYQKVLMTAPSVAVNIAHPLLQEIQSELTNQDRKFTFLCGHDSNLSSVLTSLQAEEYELPDSLEVTTPIGAMIVMEKWLNSETGKEYITLKMVYLSSEQLRSLQILDLENPPMVYDLSLSGLEKNSDGMYPLEDFMNRLEESIQKYDQLVETYGQ